LARAGQAGFVRAGDHDSLPAIMKETPVQIRNPDVIRDIRALAAQMNAPLTEAVAEAVRAQLAAREASAERDRETSRREIDAILARIWALPRLGPVPTDADFYGEDGLPR
jgi:hypothetical protein